MRKLLHQLQNHHQLHRLHKLLKSFLLAVVMLVQPVVDVLIGIVLVLIGLWLRMEHVLHQLGLYIYMLLPYVTVNHIIKPNNNRNY